MQNELIKQAIADAKALRQSAYELAKEQIAETFGPRVQEMIRLKLSEMDDESLAEEKDKEEKPVGEAKHKDEPKMEAKHNEDPMKEGDDMGEVDEVSLDELLAELDKDDEMKKEAEGDDKEDDDDDDDDKEDEGDDKEEGGMPASDEEVTELSVEELKDIIRDVVADVMGGDAAPAGDTLEPEAGDEMSGGDDAVDLGAGEEEAVSEITLDEILASLEEADKDKEPTDEAKDKEEKPVEEMKKMKAELKEAISTINTLRTELNEVNLLNAKLLYVNKIFKNKSLSEGQKLKVINAFDRAESVREAKKIYETLQDSLTTATVGKKPIKESVGFASKASGIVPKATKPIVEQNDIVSRWQVLAGIKKNK